MCITMENNILSAERDDCEKYYNIRSSRNVSRTIKRAQSSLLLQGFLTGGPWTPKGVFGGPWALLFLHYITNYRY